MYCTKFEHNAWIEITMLTVDPVLLGRIFSARSLKFGIKVALVTGKEYLKIVFYKSVYLFTIYPRVIMSNRVGQQRTPQHLLMACSPATKLLEIDTRTSLFAYSSLAVGQLIFF